jgi:hypothetical protein
MTYFNNCTTLNDVKSLYRTLAKTHHPDKGGDLATMQAINNEYAFIIRKIAAGADITSEERESEILNAEAYKNAINAIINLEGINIEICGGWIWVTGSTYQYKGIFKENGFYFASKKVAWYFRSPEYKTNNRKKMDLDQIRTKYGSQQINSKHSYSLTA